MKQLTATPWAVRYFGFAWIVLASMGCGGNESTVVQPGPDYQLTDDELRMKAEIDAVPPPEYE